MAGAASGGAANTTAAAAQQLQEYQSLILLLADADVGELHPGLGLPSVTPLASFALWDNERLKKLGRMKADPGCPKDIIRCFAKLVLAFRDLSETAHNQAVPRIGSSMPTVACASFLPPLHAEPLGPLPLVPVAKIHGVKKSRAALVNNCEDNGCHDEFWDCQSQTWAFPRGSCEHFRE